MYSLRSAALYIACFAGTAVCTTSTSSMPLRLGAYSDTPVWVLHASVYPVLVSGIPYIPIQLALSKVSFTYHTYGNATYTTKLEIYTGTCMAAAISSRGRWTEREKKRARRGRTPRRKALNKRLNLLIFLLLSSTVRWVYIHVSTYGVLVEAVSGAQGATERGHEAGIMTGRPATGGCKDCLTPDQVWGYFRLGFRGRLSKAFCARLHRHAPRFGNWFVQPNPLPIDLTWSRGMFNGIFIHIEIPNTPAGLSVTWQHDTCVFLCECSICHHL